MTCLVVLALLGQFTVPSAPVTGPTAALKARDFATQAPLTLYLDPTGNDSTDCLNPGAGACLTSQGVENKLPRGIQDQVTINVAAGTYSAAGLQVFGHWFNPRTAAGGAGINWIGALANAVPTTGTATGTATAGSTGSLSAPTTFGTLTDGAQTWSVNDSAVKGRLLTLNAGTGSGQSCIIVSNTATVLTCDHILSVAPANGSTTYTINDFASHFTGTTNRPNLVNSAAASPATLYMEGNGPVKTASATSTTRSSAPILFSRIDFSPATSGSTSVRINGQNHVAFTECKLAGNGAGAGLTLLFDPYVLLDRSYVASTSGPSMNNVFNNGGNAFVNAYGTLFDTGGGAGQAAALLGNNAVFSQCTFNTTNSSATNAISLAGSGMGSVSVSVAGSVVNCTSGGSTTGLNIADVAGTLPTMTEMLIGTSNFNNCPTGIALTGRSILYMNGAVTLTGPGSGTGISVNTGAQVRDTNSSVFATYTNELSIDSVILTYSAFNAFSPKVFFASSGSTFQGANTTSQVYSKGSTQFAAAVASSGAVPTISSGFGSSPSVTSGNAFAFRVNVGTGGSATTGVVALPTAATGWNCTAADVTTPDSFTTRQTASTTATASFKNYSATAGTALAWTASDILAINCSAF